MVTSKKKILPKKWSHGKLMPLPGCTHNQKTPAICPDALLSAQFLHMDTHTLCTQKYILTHARVLIDLLHPIPMFCGFLTTGHCGFSHIYTT